MATKLENHFPGERPAVTGISLRGDTLDANRYLDPALLKQEWDKVFATCWLIAGVAQDVAEPGDYFVFNIGRESIIVSRGDDGHIHAVHNACKHRGNRIITNERGAVKGFTCPYHAWQYDFDGTNKYIPDAERFFQGTPCDKLSLNKVRVESWAGIIWVCMDYSAPDLMGFLGELAPDFAAYHTERMSLVQDQTVHLAANWKTVIDNFSEVYHVDYLHPQHAKFVDCMNSEVHLYEGGHNLIRVWGFTVNPRYPIPDTMPDVLEFQVKSLGVSPDAYKGKVLDIRQDVQLMKRSQGADMGYDYSDLTNEQLSDVWQFNVFPNIIMTVQAEELWIMRARPHPTDPDQVWFDKLTLRLIPDEKAGNKVLSLNGMPRDMVEQAGERPEREEFTQEDVIAGKYSMTITIDQDVHYLRDMQAGMHSRGFDTLWLNEDEARIQHFHEKWNDYMGGG